jgi:hypothetical protein
VSQRGRRSDVRPVYRGPQGQPASHLGGGKKNILPRYEEQVERYILGSRVC